MAIFFCEQPRARPANAQQQQQDLASRPPCPTENSRMAEVLICTYQNGLFLTRFSWEKWDWDHITPNLGSIPGVEILYVYATCHSLKRWLEKRAKYIPQVVMTYHGKKGEKHRKNKGEFFLSLVTKNAFLDVPEDQ